MLFPPNKSATIAYDNHQDRHKQDFPLSAPAELLLLLNSNLVKSWSDHTRPGAFISIISNQIVQFIIRSLSEPC